MITISTTHNRFYLQVSFSTAGFGKALGYVQTLLQSPEINCIEKQKQNMLYEHGMLTGPVR